RRPPPASPDRATPARAGPGSREIAPTGRPTTRHRPPGAGGGNRSTCAICFRGLIIPSVPSRTARRPRGTALPPPRQATMDGCTVLLIDGDADSLAIYSLILRYCGIGVLETT